MEDKRNKIALVSGATSGIGWATSILLSKNGWKLIITGRNSDKLQTLLQIIGTDNAHPLLFDVRDKSQVEMAIQSIPQEFLPIDLLVNNAGNALGKEPFQEGNSEDWEYMIDANIKGLLFVTQAVLPKMLNGQRKQIINIGSIAGKLAYPGGNVYCASKAAVDMLTQTLRQDLLPLGFNVGQIAPGAVETEFSKVRFKGDEEKAKAVYQGFTPLIAEDIAEAILFMANRPQHVSIADLVIYPRAQANAVLFDRSGSL